MDAAEASIAMALPHHDGRKEVSQDILAA